jgi:type II secretory pathway pseudopilin PulG
VELLLVLSLLLIATGLVFPPLLRLMADQPLKEAAERTRSQLATVRLKALDAGVAWQFRFEPGGCHYLWMPQEPAASPTGTANLAATSVPANTEATSAPQTSELPQKIRFATDLNGTPFGVEHLPPEMLAGLPNAYALGQVGWSSPVVFQPDGSAVDVELAVLDARDRQMRLTIRGLTGGVTVFPLETRRRP